MLVLALLYILQLSFMSPICISQFSDSTDRTVLRADQVDRNVKQAPPNELSRGFLTGGGKKGSK